MQTETTTSTGHTLTIDTERGLLRIAGDAETMDAIPDSELRDAAADAGCRWDGDAIDETTYRLVPSALVTAAVEAMEEAAAIEISHGGGDGLHECEACRTATRAARRAVDAALDAGADISDLPSHTGRGDQRYDWSIWLDGIAEDRA